MRTYYEKGLSYIKNIIKKDRSIVKLEKKQDQGQQQKKEFNIKRKDIIICPYFRLVYFVSHNDILTIDMSCARDHMIFCTRSVALVKFKSRRDQILQSIREDMIDCCAMDCLKVWRSDNELDCCEVDEDYDEFALNSEADEFLRNEWQEEIKEISKDHDVPF